MSNALRIRIILVVTLILASVSIDLAISRPFIEGEMDNVEAIARNELQQFRRDPNRIYVISEAIGAKKESAHDMARIDAIEELSMEVKRQFEDVVRRAMMSQNLSNERINASLIDYENTFSIDNSHFQTDDSRLFIYMGRYKSIKLVSIGKSDIDIVILDNIKRDEDKYRMMRNSSLMQNLEINVELYSRQ